MSISRICRCACLLVAVVAAFWAASATPSENEPADGKAPVVPRSAEFRPRPAHVPAVSPDHPLLPVLKDARGWLDQARGSVRDFYCRVVKRERIDGFLQDYYYIDMWVREEVRDGQQVSSPLSVFMEFLGPSEVRGRRLLFVEGANEGKILVRKGGPRFEYVITKIDPSSENTKSESLCPIGQSGFVPLLAEVVATLERHLAADPSGTNTTVDRPQGAKVDGRPCHVVRVTHAEKQAGLDFHKGTYFIDAELGVPARIEKLDWPAEPGEPAPVIGEYNYTKIKLNPGLPDRTFDPKILRAKRENRSG
jgi:hypothetical protein